MTASPAQPAPTFYVDLGSPNAYLAPPSGSTPSSVRTCAGRRSCSAGSSRRTPALVGDPHRMRRRTPPRSSGARCSVGCRRSGGPTVAVRWAPGRADGDLGPTEKGAGRRSSTRHSRAHFAEGPRSPTRPCSRRGHAEPGSIRRRRVAGATSGAVKALLRRTDDRGDERWRLRRADRPHRPVRGVG